MTRKEVLARTKDAANIPNTEDRIGALMLLQITCLLHIWELLDSKADT